MRKSLLSIALLALVSLPALSQPAPSGNGQASVVETRDDRGFDWGLLGLLGLLGLIPRRRREDVSVTARPANTPNR